MGDCVMPHEGIFAVVEEGGTVRPGDDIVAIEVRDPDD
jgi:MOSC domain-containing protein YiiM